MINYRVYIRNGTRVIFDAVSSSSVIEYAREVCRMRNVSIIGNGNLFFSRIR